ncbi:hypothetical protein BDZ91DRAFT_728404 [Kalaharituber pfeilii]|nr:hypothetical protein BDZ91DRAFT_728404 [Kalaharituber pfeilii]
MSSLSSFSISSGSAGAVSRSASLTSPTRRSIARESIGWESIREDPEDPETQGLPEPVVIHDEAPSMSAWYQEQMAQVQRKEPPRLRTYYGVGGDDAEMDIPPEQRNSVTASMEALQGAVPPYDSRYSITSTSTQTTMMADPRRGSRDVPRKPVPVIPPVQSQIEDSDPEEEAAEEDVEAEAEEEEENDDDDDDDDEQGKARFRRMQEMAMELREEQLAREREMARAAAKAGKSGRVNVIRRKPVMRDIAHVRTGSAGPESGVWK